MQLHAVPVLDDNYVWLLAGEGRAVAVDPGVAAPVLAWLERNAAELEAIVLTHHHGDHVGGVADLRGAFPAVRVTGPADARIAWVDRTVAAGEEVALPWPGAKLGVVEVPGHTLSHVAYVGHGLLFSGDTLFSAGCGRLFEGSPGQMLDSLDRLAALPASTLVCCGHEYTLANLAFAAVVEPANPDIRQRIAEVSALRAAGAPSLPSTIGLELRVNPFLRIDQPGVRARLVAERGLAADAGRVAVFAALRAWKDGFRA